MSHITIPISSIHYYTIIITEIKKIKYKKILDVGCGTGEILNRIADNHENYYGIDLSDKMIDIAKSKNIVQKILLLHKEYLKNYLSKLQSTPLLQLRLTI